MAVLARTRFSAVRIELPAHILCGKAVAAISGSINIILESIIYSIIIQAIITNAMSNPSGNLFDIIICLNDLPHFADGTISEEGLNSLRDKILQYANCGSMQTDRFYLGNDDNAYALVNSISEECMQDLEDAGIFVQEAIVPDEYFAQLEPIEYIFTEKIDDESDTTNEDKPDSTCMLM
jgi:hypothetical protein